LLINLRTALWARSRRAQLALVSTPSPQSARNGSLATVEEAKEYAALGCQGRPLVWVRPSDARPGDMQCEVDRRRTEVSKRRKAGYQPAAG
jgi:hypothetical protein